MSKEQRALIELDPGETARINGHTVSRTIDAGWRIAFDPQPYGAIRTTHDLPTATQLVQP